MKKIIIGLLMLAVGFGNNIRANNITSDVEEELPDFVIIQLDDENETDEPETQDEWFQYPVFEEWGKVTLEGKLKMKGLPVTPTLKVYMQEDSLVDISVRAPLIGEAVRIALTADSLIAINKLNKTYVKMGVPQTNLGNGEGRMELREGILLGLQDLLLGRFFLPGVDIENADLDELVDVYFAGGGHFNVVPKEPLSVEGMEYGYVVDNYFTPLMLVVMAGNMELNVSYIDKDSGYDIEIMANDGRHIFSPKLEFKEPEWGKGKNEPVKLDRKYREVDIKDWINGMMQM